MSRRSPRSNVAASVCASTKSRVAEICADPRSLEVSVELSDELATWQAEYDSTLDHDYPPNSSFPSEAARAQWEQRGQERFERLVLELGESVIVRLELPGGNVT